MTIPTNTIRCHTCGQDAKLVRSVRLRHDPNPEFNRIVQRWPDPNAIPADDQDVFKRAYLQWDRDSKHRRAFICEACYKRLDNPLGVAEIVTPEGVKVFGLSGDSRASRAAVYDYEKWRRYQARLGRTLGIDLQTRGADQ